jgi:glycosyltransferase involved in cell wall biosynthesis
MAIKRLLYAPNIHQGGGKILLLSLIKAVKGDDVIFALDERLDLPVELLEENVIWVKPTLISRLWLELRLQRLIAKDTLVLCMGNLPLLFAKQGIQKVFVQNRYLVEYISLTAFSFRPRVRIMIERWWLRSRVTRVNSFIVQTPTMKRLTQQAFGVETKVLPFLSRETCEELAAERKSKEKKYDFVYIASGEPHKNHKTLIYAWIALAKENISPSLCLTLHKKIFPELCDWIFSKIENYDLKISIVGECFHEDINKIYQQSGALIYPSLLESFGLPLIEATLSGLPVLASNKSYVMDVINPSAVFDPYSFQDIANAVRDFDRTPSSLAIELLEAEDFLEYAFKK